MFTLAPLLDDTLPRGKSTRHEHAMTTAAIAPAPPSTQDRHFDTVLKGGVGASVLFIAATGTMLGAIGHSNSNTLLYVAGAVGAMLGAICAHITSRRAH
jgi:hypothetical protein